MHVLFVLLWKLLLIRKRRKVYTIWSLFVSTVFFVLFWIYREPAQKQKEYRENLHVPLEEVPGPTMIMYYPSTEWTNGLMDEVGKSINLSRLVEFSADGNTVDGYFSLSEKDAIPQVVIFTHQVMNDKSAFVNFHVPLNDESPLNLNYTISMKKNLKESSKKKTLHFKPEINYQHFLRLQWAIDSSFLKLTTGYPSEMNVLIEEIPLEHPIPFALYSGAKYVSDTLAIISRLSPVFSYIMLINRMAKDRLSGVRELIKMAGVPIYLIEFADLLDAMPEGILYALSGTIFSTTGYSPLLRHTSSLLIFINLILYYLNAIFMGYAVSCVVAKMQFVNIIALLFFCAMPVPADMLLNTEKLQKVSVYISFLLFAGPTNIFWMNVEALEVNDEGLTFSKIWSSHDPSTCSVALAYFGAILQCIMYYSIAHYLLNVRPGTYGTKKPWNYIFKKEYWRKTPIVVFDEGGADGYLKDPRYFEEPASDAVPGVKVVNICKVYNGKMVLSHVSLDIYKGEITVLLGNNGAGKTTLMSIITGMNSATEGNVYVDGVDVAAYRGSLRKHFSMCTQQNIVIPDLTVFENVMFFAMLKGESYETAEGSSSKLITDMNLDSRWHYISDELSGGMKRRLQLACALTGGSPVLLLDEPTSGLDVETRRELWNLMRSLRGHRAVLLTTHFMEEADALGDRVAVLHNGRLKCYATPMHLKTHLGSGYSLTISTKGLPKENEITSLITSVIPDVTLKHKDCNGIFYSVPLEKINSFPALFMKLEEGKAEFDIESIGLGIVSLEDVFLSLCSDLTTTFTAEDVDTTVMEPIYEKQTGLKLYLRQFSVLVKRHYQSYWGDKWMFFLTQVLMPIAVICIFALYFYYMESLMSQKKVSTLDKEGVVHKRLFYNYKGERNKGLRLLSTINRYSSLDLEVTDTDDIREAVVKDFMRMPYNMNSAGVELNDTVAKVLYSASGRHVAPAALNVLSNVLAAQKGLGMTSRSVDTFDRPLDALEMVIPKSVGVMYVQNALTIYVFIGTLEHAVQLPIKEREIGTRHIHMMSGCPPAVLWLATLCAHFLLYFFVIVLPIVLSFSIDYYDTLNQLDFMIAVCGVLTLGLLAVLTFQYFIALYINISAIIFCISALGIPIGIMENIKETKDQVQEEHLVGALVKTIAFVLSYLIPTATLTLAVYQLSCAAIANAVCNLNVRNCAILGKFGLEKCCAEGKGTYRYYCFKRNREECLYGVGSCIVTLICQTIVYMVVIILAEYGLIKWLSVRMKKEHETPPIVFRDEMVHIEERYVDDALALSLDERKKPDYPDVLLVGGVCKQYFRFLLSCEPVTAVKKVSFSVKKGECFGLLGLNGAGKSTTFKMITAETVPTKGKIFANGRMLGWPRGEYLKFLGYCPQYSGLDDFLSGSQNLQLILTLRGLNKKDVRTEVRNWIAVAGLEKYGNIPISDYSGGCKRRIATVAALASGARLTLLDEPTTGVDVSARRRVWLALKKGLRNDRSVIITSHSMDEMEALCSRIAILAGGELACIGSASALKTAYGVGHSVKIKLFLTWQGEKKDVEELKSFMHNKFNCTLKDQHATVIHYHINETLSYSTLFLELEELKRQFPKVVEDYYATDTTLEEVFLAFTTYPMSGSHRQSSSRR